MNFTEKLELLMAEKDITRGELATKSGVPYTTIVSFWDKGYGGIRLTTLRKLAVFFDCTIDYLADDNVTDRKKPFSFENLTPSEIEMVQSYLRAQKSDQEIVKNLAKAIADFIVPVVQCLIEYSPGEKLLNINQKDFYIEYHAKLKEIGVRDLPPYSCRHTTATALARGKNISPLLIQRIMRHSLITTTQRYVHTTTEDSVQAINTLDPEKSCQ